MERYLKKKKKKPALYNLNTTDNSPILFVVKVRVIFKMHIPLNNDIQYSFAYNPSVYLFLSVDQVFLVFSAINTYWKSRISRINLDLHMA